MKRFKNILVGVDLASADLIIASKLSTATNKAIENALWLAKHNEARLVFFAALESHHYLRFLAEDSADVEESLIEEYEHRLAALASRAIQEGVDASHVLTVGKSWIEIIRQVLKNEYDLVVVGSRQRGPTSSTFLGSTGMNSSASVRVLYGSAGLERLKFGPVLVADDLSEVSDLALTLGVSLAHLQGIPLRVLHVLELGIGRPQWDSFPIRQLARSEANRMIKEQLTRVEANRLQRPAEIEIVVDDADAAILREIRKHDVGLLVMATVARGGIAGLLTGNTAERLLPEIPCSVLAVKPAGFECPLTTD